MFTSPTAISDINYYKNRLFFFTTNGTVISSKAGSIDDLFIETGITSSLIDPIDLAANSNQRVPCMALLLLITVWLSLATLSSTV